MSTPAFGDSAPSYSVQGAYALYSVIGGFIPFFSGVNGTVSYTVTQLFSNGTMLVSFNANLSQGNEAPASQSSFNFTDSISSPQKFPAVPLSSLSNNQIRYQNITATFQKNTQVTVPAGTYDVSEFVGKDENDTTTFLWFDKSTGIAIEMAGGGGAFQLLSSNIATPISQPSGLAVSLPYILVFVLVFVGGAVLFLAVRRYYSGSIKAEPSKSVQKGSKKSALKNWGVLFQ